MTVQEILMMLPDLSIEDLRKINNVACKVIDLKVQMMALEFSPEDKVTWISKKYGEKTGTIVSIRGKTVRIITAEDERWRVHAGLLTKI